MTILINESSPVKEKKNKDIIKLSLGFIWILVVILSYFYFNLPYYTQKISVFINFIFGLIE